MGSSEPSIGEALALSENQLRDLSALFSAIMTETGQHDRAYRLASIGVYLCDDWSEVAARGAGEP